MNKQCLHDSFPFSLLTVPLITKQETSLLEPRSGANQSQLSSIPTKKDVAATILENLEKLFEVIYSMSQERKIRVHNPYPLSPNLKIQI